MPDKSRNNNWDGRSRPADDVYRERWNEIFNKKEKRRKMKKGRRYIEPMTGRGDETVKKDVKKIKREAGKTFDGVSRPSDDTYREEYNRIFGEWKSSEDDEIFGKKEDNELKESYKQSLKNKKERDDKEKSVSELLREGYEEEKAQEDDQ